MKNQVNTITIIRRGLVRVLRVKGLEVSGGTNYGSLTCYPPMCRRCVTIWYMTYSIHYLYDDSEAEYICNIEAKDPREAERKFWTDLTSVVITSIKES